MHIVPVVDLLKGQVVRGVAGERRNYRPVVSKLTASALPIDVARAFRDHFGLSLLYVADLDALAGSPPALATYVQLQEDGFQLWVDAGLRHAGNAAALLQVGVAGIIAGLETLASPQELALLGAQAGWERVLFSLDLKEGRPLTLNPAWRSSEPVGIAGQAVELGVQRLIVLDLARVGMSGGPATEDLCLHLSAAHPGLELIAGGGVRHVDDLLRLQHCEVRAALVASALHDGRLTAEEVQLLTGA